MRFQKLLDPILSDDMHFFSIGEILNSSGSLAQKSTCNDTTQIPERKSPCSTPRVVSEGWNLQFLHNDIAFSDRKQAFIAFLKTYGHHRIFAYVNNLSIFTILHLKEKTKINLEMQFNFYLL